MEVEETTVPLPPAPNDQDMTEMALNHLKVPLPDGWVAVESLEHQDVIQIKNMKVIVWSCFFLNYFFYLNF